MERNQNKKLKFLTLLTEYYDLSITFSKLLNIVINVNLHIFIKHTVKKGLRQMPIYKNLAK